MLDTKEQEFSEQFKRIAKDIAQKEKEIQKLKDEVFKVIMGESQFSQSLLSDMVNTKEQELNELKQKHDEIKIRIEELSTLLVAQKASCSDLTNWESRFDEQDTMEKKAMLINIIDRILIKEDEIAVDYIIKYNYLWEDEQNAIIESESDEQKLFDGFLYSSLVKRDMQPSRLSII